MNDDILLRPARATDLPEVYSGELDYMRQIEPEHEARWQQAMRAHLRQWTENLERMTVAERAGRFAGYAFWQVDGYAAVLASIYVARELRGAGLGRCLLERFIAEAGARGHRTLLLGVHRDNPARFLYEKSGFVFTHEDGPYRHYRYAPA
jgi:[ribosomal protein S18]-alanine N-acetyltransferase